MVRRRLTQDEEALWLALARTVRPIRPGVRRVAPEPAAVPLPPQKGLTPAPAPPVAAPPPRKPTAMLDTGWEKRIRGGTIMPDMSIDLHGHSLAAAHGQLNQAIAAALARDVRVMLVVTGKPPKTKDVTDASRRGAIRGEIGHWLETSPYADRIASVRIAHPRHGGDGALYLILRRKK
ncbi:Smr/MutS family protein [Sphingobium sp. CR2-8]|uniref:Smr/MutS family protein n=1 Tax=Sphingobium sp. CR2-8 TaxID=1306534 RepID=UPI002DBCF18C|nr:Smr/MutS family protein [Sphingobium sp. CR2-8]MEC3912063.1 Smr/MutS family protein [Sphingobium sp. CR2-8]